jgi:hypothetical protein
MRGLRIIQGRLKKWKPLFSYCFQFGVVYGAERLPIRDSGCSQAVRPPESNYSCRAIPIQTERFWDPGLSVAASSGVEPRTHNGTESAVGV